MATLTKEIIDRVTANVGRFNTDILTGWEAGLMGKRRVGGKLHDRRPPDHYFGDRYSDWVLGYRAGLRNRPYRVTVFSGTKPDGEPVVVSRKGWVARGPVVTQMERQGVTGDVRVTFLKDSTIVRTVVCGI